MITNHRIFSLMRNSIIVIGIIALISSTACKGINKQEAFSDYGAYIIKSNDNLFFYNTDDKVYYYTNNTLSLDNMKVYNLVDTSDVKLVDQ